MSFSKFKKRKLNEEEGSGRAFQEWWTERYGMIHRENKALCAMCLESVVCRTSSVKHYESSHSWLLGKSEDEQKEHISRELKKVISQSTSFVNFVKSSSNLVAASFEVSKIIAKHGKLVSDGDYIKEGWLECASYLFEDFKNKDKVIQRIKDLPISRNTLKREL